MKNTKAELEGKFELITSEKPYSISEKIVFLGQIPRLTHFESQATPFILEDGTPDFVPDDSALALEMPEGLFVVTGCGHAGIVNTLEHARKITGNSQLYGILGGFHLKDKGIQTQETVRYLLENKLNHIYPSHCTELPALSLFYENFGSTPLKTGSTFSF